MNVDSSTVAETATAHKRPLTVSIVEDSDKLRDGLAALVNMSDQFQCASVHRTGEDAYRLIPLKKPDVILMDINLPGMSGIECVRLLKAALPSVRIIMHTVYKDGERLFQSLRAGADGYLLKHTAPEKLLDALLDACNGNAPISSRLSRMLVEYFQNQTSSDPTETLSARENQILDHLSKGYRYKEIADVLGISPGTVHSHLHKIYEKLHVSSRTEAVVKYLGH